jgi:hypothetical protein
MLWARRPRRVQTFIMQAPLDIVDNLSFILGDR